MTMSELLESRGALRADPSLASLCEADACTACHSLDLDAAQDKWFTVLNWHSEIAWCSQEKLLEMSCAKKGANAGGRKHERPDGKWPIN